MKKKIYIIASIFFIIDLISKTVIINTISLYQSIKVINNFFYLTYVQNKGAAFSIFSDQRILLLLVTMLALFFINRYLNKEKYRDIEVIIYSMIIGGIFGNLFDRIIYGYVIDFFDFKIFDYNYPVFNLADTFIVVGSIILIIDMIRGNNKNENICKKK